MTVTTMQRIRWVLPAALCAVGTLLAADGAPDDSSRDEQPVKEEYVEVNVSNLPESNTIATKLDLPLQLTPFNVGTVGQALIEERRDEVLSDALKCVSGINPQNGSGVHDFFVIRGFDSLNGSLLLYDGASEPEVSFYPTYNIAAVEVLKGPGGFLYGKDALAGVVNVVRKQPLPTDFGVLSLGGGSHGTLEGALDWNLAAEDGATAFRINTLWADSDGYRDAHPSRQVALNPSLAFRLGSKSRLNVNLEYVDAEFTPDAGLPLLNNAIPDVPRRRSYQSPFDFSDQTVTRFQLDYQVELSDSVTLRDKLYHRGLDWNSQGTLFLGAADFGPGVGRYAFRGLTFLDNTQRFSGNQLEALLRLESGPVSHDLLVGLETAWLSDESAIDFGILDPISIDDPQESGAPPTGLMHVQGNDTTNRILAPYVVDMMRFGEQVHLLLGARYDNIRLSGRIDSAGRVSRDDSELSPSLGIVYAPLPSVSVYANAGESHAPVLTRPNEFVDPQTLKPETSRGYELGVKTRREDGRLQGTLALYEIRREDVPIPDPNNVTQQAGDVRSRGVELELAAEPIPGLHLFATYAYNDATLLRFNQFTVTQAGPAYNDYSGNRPAFAPQHLLNLWLSRRFDNGLLFAAGTRFIGEQYIGEDNAFRIDGAVVVDARLSYDLKRVTLRLALNNLLDREYETRGAAGSASVTPAAPFSAYAGIDIRY